MKKRLPWPLHNLQSPRKGSFDNVNGMLKICPGHCPFQQLIDCSKGKHAVIKLQLLHIILIEAPVNRANFAFSVMFKGITIFPVSAAGIFIKSIEATLADW